MGPRLDLTTSHFARQFHRNLLANEGLFRDGPVPHGTLELIRLRVSQVNGCGFCVDMHYKDAVHAGEDPARLNLVIVWREATVFSGPERAALALAEESARIADNPHGVSDEAWTAVREHYDDAQIVVLIAACTQINAWNRLNVILRTPAGSYDPAATAAWHGAASG